MKTFYSNLIFLSLSLLTLNICSMELTKDIEQEEANEKQTQIRPFLDQESFINSKLSIIHQKVKERGLKFELFTNNDLKKIVNLAIKETLIEQRDSVLLLEALKNVRAYLQKETINQPLPRMLTYVEIEEESDSDELDTEFVDIMKSFDKFEENILTTLSRINKIDAELYRLSSDQYLLENKVNQNIQELTAKLLKEFNEKCAQILVTITIKLDDEIVKLDNKIDNLDLKCDGIAKANEQKIEELTIQVSERDKHNADKLNNAIEKQEKNYNDLKLEVTALKDIVTTEITKIQKEQSQQIKQLKEDQKLELAKKDKQNEEKLTNTIQKLKQESDSELNKIKQDFMEELNKRDKANNRHFKIGLAIGIPTACIAGIIAFFYAKNLFLKLDLAGKAISHLNAGVTNLNVGVKHLNGAWNSLSEDVSNIYNRQ